ncbi:MAG: amidohydrolase family protein [FCB group bacterium]|nr:amidohydrolase family protein [FCB group bacterium]
MGRRGIITILLVAVAVIAGCSQHKQSADELAIKAFINVSVLPMNKDTVLENYTVVVRDQEIVSVGPVDEVDVPEGAYVISGVGKYLLPGLTDMHVHVENEDAMILFLANGVTTVRNMWGSPSHLVWKDQIQKGEIIGPTIYTAGPIIDGPPGVWDGSVVLDDPDEVEQLVVEHIDKGYDFLKIYYLRKDAFNALLATAKKYGIPVIGHASDDVGQEGVLTSGQHSIEHLDGYWKILEADDSPFRRDDFDLHSYFMTWNHIDENKMPRAASLTEASGIWNCPTLVVYQRDASTAQADSLYALPEMKYMDPVSLASWDPSTYFFTRNRTVEEWEASRNEYGVLKKFTGYLHRAGARLLLGTDTPNPFVVPGFSIHTELQIFIKAGMSPYEAIKTGTYNAAECLGDLDEFGTITEGKRADFMLLGGNPLEDIGNLTKRVGVMVRGQWFSEEDLQSRLEEIVSSYTPPQNRFEGVTRIESKGQLVLSTQYELRYNDIPFGEELFGLYDLGSNRYELISQTITDKPYFTQTFVTMHLDSSFRCDHLEYLNETSTGNNSLQFTQAGDSLYVSGGLKGGINVEKKRSLTQDELLSPPRVGVSISDVPVIASYLQIGRLIQAMEVGDSLTVGNTSLQLALPFEFVEETISVKRLPDSAWRSGEEVVPVRAFSYGIILPHAEINSTLLTDFEGCIVSLDIEQQIGHLRFDLVSKEQSGVEY